MADLQRQVGHRSHCNGNPASNILVTLLICSLSLSPAIFLRRHGLQSSQISSFSFCTWRVLKGTKVFDGTRTFLEDCGDCKLQRPSRHYATWLPVLRCNETNYLRTLPVKIIYFTAVAATATSNRVVAAATSRNST